jgi:hypothetical protein
LPAFRAVIVAAVARREPIDASRFTDAVASAEHPMPFGAIVDGPRVIFL